jgi:hypothetical protein
MHSYSSNQKNKEEKMKKTVIAAVAFFVLFAFSIPGAMAQTWTWSNPAPHTGTTLVELGADSMTGNLYAIDNTGAIVSPTLGTPVTDVAVAAGSVPPVVDMAGASGGIFYVIGAAAVGTWNPATSAFDTTMTQPFIPATDAGVFASLAVGQNGMLYVLYNGATAQYILTGTPPVIAEPAVITFHPRTLNLGSKGNWVSVHIELPAGLDENLIDVSTVRISEIAVEGFTPKPVEIYTAPGAPWKVELNDLGAQVLKVKFIRYNKGGAELDEQSLIYQLKSIMTGAQKGKYPVTLTIDGLLSTGEWFSGTATFDANVNKKLP